MLFLSAMKFTSLGLALCILSIIIFYGCANIVPPTGGKKDTTPPKLLEVIPADSQLNNRATKIELRFDEFVVLQDPGKEIQVSPLLPYPVITILSGKKVTVEIPDSLLNENTTYRISFGKAIQDLHENNIFANYSYIFSTGDFFDSLVLNGFVLDAATGKPAKDVVILLYDASASDSAIVKKKPLYTASATSSGTFVIPGLPERNFKVYALKDENKNYVYDGEEEMIAFVDSVFVPVDSIIAPIELRLFKELLPVDTLTSDASSESSDASSGKFRSRKKDDSKQDVLLYSVNIDTGNIDKRSQDITKPVVVTFNTAIDTYNTNQIQLVSLLDSNEIEVPVIVRKDTIESRLLVEVRWEENTAYTLRLLKDFVTDTSGKKATPSKYTFRTKSDDDYGIIKIQLTEKYYDTKYVVQVTNDKDTVYQAPVTDTLINLTRLQPGKYNIRIIVDENRNGKWDTGDLFAKKQPEFVIPYDETIELRAGWENVIDFIVPVTEDPKAGTSPLKWGKRGDK